MRVLRVGEGEDGEAWAEAVRARKAERKELLKSDSGCTVWRVRLNGRDVVLKAWSWHDPLNRVKAWLRASRAHRQWRGAETLMKLGVRTARPLVLLGTGPLAFLIMEWLDGPTLLEVMARPEGGAGEAHALAAAVGTQVARFGAWFNRDHKPSNLIVQGGRDNLSLAVIDTVAIRRARPDSHARMLASLVIEPTGCGCPPRLALRMRALTAYLAARGSSGKQARNELWRRVARIITRHGDPTPRVNPLAGGGSGAGASRAGA